MSLFCRFGSHIAQAKAIWNDGLYFSKCKRCGTPLVRRASSTWESVPRGYRIVWKPGERGEIVGSRELPEQSFFSFR
jgi:hypothetical protein